MSTLPSYLTYEPDPSGCRLAQAKRVVDFFLACLLIALLAPVYVVLILAIMASGSGMPVFGHQRIGLHGRKFHCLKFRTMIPDAEQVLHKMLEADQDLRAEWELEHKLKNDPRITKIGAFLRRTSLDELPQLVNVVRGEMSLIGPRPVVEAELGRYGRASRLYLSVRPGMTGLWQVSGRNDVDYRRRVALDSYYVRAHGAGLDISILIRTVKVVFARGGAY